MEPLDIEVGLEQLRAELAGVNVKKTEWAIKVIFKVLFGLIRYLEEREARHRRITMATLGLRDSRLGEDGAE